MTRKQPKQVDLQQFMDANEDKTLWSHEVSFRRKTCNVINNFLQKDKSRTFQSTVATADGKASVFAGTSRLHKDDHQLAKPNPNQRISHLNTMQSFFAGKKSSNDLKSSRHQAKQPASESEAITPKAHSPSKTRNETRQSSRHEASPSKHASVLGSTGAAKKRKVSGVQEDDFAAHNPTQKHAFGQTIVSKSGLAVPDHATTAGAFRKPSKGTSFLLPPQAD